MRKECKRTTEIPKKKKKKTIKPRQNTDIFQRLFAAITIIIQELWLERNTNRHNPAKGQLQMAKITKVECTVTHMYSLCYLIMPNMTQDTLE